MGYAEDQRALLRPMRIYRLEGSVNGGELEAQGRALDREEQRLEELEREMLLTTAQDWGLEAGKKRL